MIPAALIFVVFFWALISIVKYWYCSKMKINYAYKLDDKVLEEIRRPSKENMEKMNKSKRTRNRGAKFTDEPEECFYSWQDGKEMDELNECPNGMTSKEGDASTQKRRPTLFEEMDLRKNGIKNKRGPSKYDRSMFEDPLTRLHRDLQEMKTKASKQKDPPT